MFDNTKEKIESTFPVVAINSVLIALIADIEKMRGDVEEGETLLDISIAKAKVDTLKDVSSRIEEVLPFRLLQK